MSSERKRSRGPAQIPRIEVDFVSLGEPLVITAVVQVQGRNDRLNVALNGAAIGDVTLDFVADEKLREGRRLAPGAAENMVRAVQRTRVLDKALDLLAVRARSSRELSQRLRRAGATDPEIAWVQERLEAQGFLDDASFARQLARGRVLAGGTSRRRVIGVLRKKGVSAEIAEEAIDETLAEVELDEFGAASAAAEKRIRALRSLEPQKQRQRLYAFLARRGYEQDIIRRVISELLPRS